MLISLGDQKDVTLSAQLSNDLEKSKSEGSKSPVGKTKAAIEFILFLGLLWLEHIVCPMTHDLNAWSSGGGTLLGGCENSGDGSLREPLRTYCLTLHDASWSSIK